MAYSGRMSDIDIATMMDHLLDGAEQELGTLVLGAVRPFVENAFRQGLRAGVSIARDSAARSFDAAEKNAERILAQANPSQHTPAVVPRRQAKRRGGTSSTRVAHGTIRPIVEAVLSSESRGLRIVEIQQQAAILDKNIAPASISNELRRNLGTRYRQVDGLWFLNGDPQQALGLAPATVPSALVGAGGAEASASPASAPHSDVGNYAA